MSGLLKGIHFFYISSENVCASCIKFGLDKRYSFGSMTDRTRSHSFIPVSMNSIKMQRISFDNIFSHVTFHHIDTETSMSQQGRYIACLYDTKWYIVIIMGGYDENNDVKVKFMRHDRLCLFWYEHDNITSVLLRHHNCKVEVLDNIL